MCGINAKFPLLPLFACEISEFSFVASYTKKKMCAKKIFFETKKFFFVQQNFDVEITTKWFFHWTCVK